MHTNTYTHTHNERYVDKLKSMTLMFSTVNVEVVLS